MEITLPRVSLRLDDATLARQLRRAAKDFGAVHILHHTLRADEALDNLQKWTNLSHAQKASATPPKPGGKATGYVPLAAESGNQHFLELKEGYCFAAANNVWPDNHAALLGDRWAPSMLRLLDESYRATDAIGRALALLLRRPAAYRADTPAASLSLMRAFRYFEPSHAPSLAPGLPRTGSSPHTDWFLVTLVVHRDRRGGLQLFRHGEWRPGGLGTVGCEGVVRPMRTHAALCRGQQSAV